MKTLITTHWVTLDGYVAGPEGALDWIRADDDLMRYEMALVNGADTLLLGRGTYGDFSGYWPTVAADATAEPGQRVYAQRLDRLKKVVASRTLDVASWPESEILRDVTTDSIGKLKQGPGTIIVYGSVQVVRELARLRLADEIHLLVHPLTVGSGTPLFDTRVDLERVRVEPFVSGVTLAVYRLG